MITNPYFPVLPVAVTVSAQVVGQLAALCEEDEVSIPHMLDKLVETEYLRRRLQDGEE